MKRPLARGIAGLSAALLLLLIALIPSALADGSEQLGPPSIPIADGTGVATGGTGLFTQPGTIDVTVPTGASVEQVLLYWEGLHTAGNGDDTITVAGNAVTGTLIGGPDFFVHTGSPSPVDPDGPSPNRDIFTSSYRADITGLGLIGAGASSLSVSGLGFDFANNGAGVVVIFDDGSGASQIDVRDGSDIAHLRFPEPRRSTVPQTYTFTPAGFTRTAQIDLMVGSVAPDRPNAIEVTTGGETTTLVNQLGDTDGPQWDALTIPVTVPAGADSLSVRLISADDGSGRLPASLMWVNSVFSILDCPPLSNIPQSTRGAAYGADANVLGLALINELGRVDTQAPGQPSDEADQFLGINLLGLANVGLVTTQSSSTLAPSPTTTSSATVASTNLLLGAVRADTIRAVSQSVASGSGASSNSAGSTIQNLRINGQLVGNVAPGTVLNVRSPLSLPFLGRPIIAQVHVQEESKTSTFANGEARTEHSINMLRIVLIRPFLTLPAGAEIIVAHAESQAQAPAQTCRVTSTVSGEAFTASVEGAVLGQPLAELRVGSALLPPTGGMDSDGANVSLPGVATSATASNTTSGALTPDPNATSRSVVEDANVLGGLVTADVLDVRSTSTADGANAATDLEFTFVNLRVAGVPINPNVPPNTEINVPLPGGGFVRVIINEQTVNSNGSTDTEGTVNAIHAFVFAPLGVLQSEVIVASAHSDAHV